MDSVEENIHASRRLLLLYTASTFINKRHTSSTSSNNNNNISKTSNSNDSVESKTGDSSSISSFDGGEEVYQDTRQQLECVAAMHRALLEGSLKVRKQTFQCKSLTAVLNVINTNYCCINYLHRAVVELKMISLVQWNVALDQGYSTRLGKGPKSPSEMQSPATENDKYAE